MKADELLDAAHIASAAAWAANQLRISGMAKVRLAPGDMTEYRIVIAAPGIEWAYGEPRDGRHYWVTLCANFGTGYEWHGGRIDPGYAAEKWTNPSVSKATRAWTGEVVARFLTATAEAMQAVAS
jgi:hypothetical protein